MTSLVPSSRGSAPPRIIQEGGFDVAHSLFFSPLEFSVETAQSTTPHRKLVGDILSIFPYVNLSWIRLGWCSIARVMTGSWCHPGEINRLGQRKLGMPLRPGICGIRGCVGRRLWHSLPQVQLSPLCTPSTFSVHDSADSGHREVKRWNVLYSILLPPVLCTLVPCPS